MTELGFGGRLGNIAKNYILEVNSQNARASVFGVSGNRHLLSVGLVLSS